MGKAGMGNASCGQDTESVKHFRKQRIDRDWIIVYNNTRIILMLALLRVQNDPVRTAKEKTP